MRTHHMFCKYTLFDLLSLLIWSTLMHASLTVTALPSWPMGGHDMRRSGQSEYIGTQSEYLAWNYNGGGTNLASVSVGANGTIYLLSSSGNVEAVSSDATLEWTFLTGSDENNVCTPAIDTNGNIYVYADDFYALNSTGHLLWHFAIPGITSPSFDSSPALDEENDAIYFCDQYALYALSLNGIFLWNFTAPDLVSKAPAINIDGNIIIGGLDNVYAINPSDGSMVWMSHPGASFLTEVSIGTDGTIYIGSGGSNDNELFALDQNGGALWNYTTAGFPSGRAAVISGGDVIVRDSSRTVYRLSSEGALRWTYQLPSSLTPSFAVGLDGVVYFGGGSVLYALTSDGDLLWSFSDGVSGSIGPPAIGDDGTVYVSSSSEVYAVNIALTPAPSSVPSSFPTVVCPGGEVVASTQGQRCEDCDQGEFSDGVHCQECSRGRTNVGQGNSDCELYVSTVEPIIVYAAAGIFLLCVLVSFLLSVIHGGPLLSIIGVLLVVGDQISDMLFASQATFYSYSLLLASGFFCVIPLLPFAYIVLVRASPLDWRCVRSSKRMHRKISRWHSDSGGWLFHKLSIHSMQWKFFPFIVIMTVGDITWPFIRVTFMICYAVGLCAFQMFVLVLGVLIHATKLITHHETNDLYWWLWQGEEGEQKEREDDSEMTNDLETRLTISFPEKEEKKEERETKSTSYNREKKDNNEMIPLTNSIILMETIFENIPQLLIQCINNKLAYGSKVWSTLAIISIAFTSLMVATVVYHFGYYMFFSEQRSFVEVPKFDLFIGTLRSDVDEGERDEDDDEDDDDDDVESKVISSVGDDDKEHHVDLGDDR